MTAGLMSLAKSASNLTNIMNHLLEVNGVDAPDAPGSQSLGIFTLQATKSSSLLDEMFSPPVFSKNMSTR